MILKYKPAFNEGVSIFFDRFLPIGAGILSLFGMPQIRPGAMRRNLKGHRSTAYNLLCWEGKEPKEVCSTLSRYLLSGFVHDVRN